MSAFSRCAVIKSRLDPLTTRHPRGYPFAAPAAVLGAPLGRSTGDLKVPPHSDPAGSIDLKSLPGSTKGPVREGCSRAPSCPPCGRATSFRGSSCASRRLSPRYPRRPAARWSRAPDSARGSCPAASAGKGARRRTTLAIHVSAPVSERCPRLAPVLLQGGGGAHPPLGEPICPATSVSAAYM